ncbi:hypothetical protein D9M71_209840 [compost metagenome]
MQVQAQFLAGGADGADFVRGVDAADFGGLGQGHHTGFRVVDVLALERDLADRFRGQLAVFSTGDQQFGAVGEEFRGAAFVGFDVGGFRADHAVVTLAQRRQRQRVGGGAVEGEKHFAVGFEQFAESVGGAGGPLVVAVCALVAVVGLFHGRPGFRADTGIVVAGELLALVGHGLLPWSRCLW